jgi:hypothetical protein
MALAGVNQQLNLCLIELQILVIDLQRERAGAGSVPWVVVIVSATTIVQQRERFYNAWICAGCNRQFESVVSNPSPVWCTVDATPLEGEAWLEESQESRSVHEA